MKTFKFLSITVLFNFLISANVLQAQTQTFTNLNVTGKLGVGTTTPIYTLDVNGNARVQYELNISYADANIGGSLILSNPAKTGTGQASQWKLYNMSGVYGNSLQFYAYDNIGCENGGLCSPRLVLMDNGNVGIGTSNPQYMLDVSGYVHSEQIVLGISKNQYIIHSQTQFPNIAPKIYFAPRYENPTTSTGDWDWDKSVVFDNGNLYVLNGKVGIGTSTPYYKLDVQGTLRAREIKVNLNTGADFVFEKDYNLMPISDLSKFVTENKHLPDIPSAAQMTEGDTDMGELVIKLLQKVEEQTLYIIEMEKRIKDLEKK